MHHFSHKFCSINNVIVLDEDKLVPGLTFGEIKKMIENHLNPPYNIGWYFQQFMKLGFALTPYPKENYLVWDADTIPVNFIRFKDESSLFFTKTSEYHKPYFDTIYHILGLEKTNDYSFIAEHMIFNVPIVKSMISDIERFNVLGEVWYEKIINAVDKDQPNGFSEFETYGTYVLNYYPLIYKIQSLKTYRHAGLVYHRLITFKKINILSNLGYHTLSFEEHDSPSFPKSIIWLCLRVYTRLLNKIYKLLFV
ncbi:hypothetical protein [Microbacter margulisiae]|uniref:Uncharacterized protein n=1 Tax=Microbacter margulisiae TaxID=1350067 RepID=A0A7W5DQN8_9PORP|nr:hypothetical protein [Microbacter margulisiae]MBB3187201.1 hypothetical protein [Microbacter margulisiae]